MVQKLGPVRALGWFAWHFPRYQRTLAVFGPVRTHLLCTVISLVNNSPYCSYGHGYALQLTYLREYGQLFPLDDQQLAELCGSLPALIRYRLLDAIRRAGLHGNAIWLDRAIALTEQRAVDHDDVRVAYLVRMLGVPNATTIADHTEPDEAHDPVNKDLELKSRYHALRAAAAS
jgi:hypothetical protein